MKIKSDELAGVLLALAGALLFSTKAVMVKLAYYYPVDPVSLLTLRMVFALPVYLYLVLRIAKKEMPTWRQIALKHWMGLVATAGLGFYLSSFFDFEGLQYIDATVERLILFIYPTLIAILGRIIFKERLTLFQIFALIITYAGLVFVFGQNLHDISLGNDFWKGSLLIFMCAITFASFYIFSQWLLPFFGAIAFTSLSMTVACCLVMCHYLLTADFLRIFRLPAMVYVYGFLMAVIATVIPTYLVNYAIRALGATRVGILGSIGPVSTITLAYFLLGEKLQIGQAIGALLIIVGVTIVSFETRRKKQLKAHSN